MSAEERDKKLKSAINYCKDSYRLHSNQQEKSRSRQEEGYEKLKSPINYCKDSTCQARCWKCAENHSHLNVLHCSGSKSFLWRQEELELESPEIGRIEFYKRTHCKDGYWTSPLAEVFYMHMMERKLQTMLDGGIPLTEDQICEEVLGTTPGYVCGLGHGVRPNSSARAGQATRTQLEETTRRAKHAERWVVELAEEVQALTQKTDRLESLFESIASRMDLGGSFV